MSHIEARLGLHILGAIALGHTKDEDIEAGADPVVEVHIPVGIPVPIGPSQAVGAPLAVLALKLNKSEALEFFGEGLSAAEKLPDPKPSIPIASNMAEVAEQAEAIRKLGG